MPLILSSAVATPIGSKAAPENQRLWAGLETSLPTQALLRSAAAVTTELPAAPRSPLAAVLRTERFRSGKPSSAVAPSTKSAAPVGLEAASLLQTLITPSWAAWPIGSQ